jgi:hypothetical protein
MNRYPSGRFVAALVAAWLVSVALTACVPDKPCRTVIVMPDSTTYCAEYEK